MTEVYQPVDNLSIQQVMQGELDINTREHITFRRLGQPEYIGLLLNHDVSILKHTYPSLLNGMGQLYEHLLKQTDDDVEFFIRRFFYDQGYHNIWYSNDEVEEFKERFRSGKYREHMDAYLEYSGSQRTRRREDGLKRRDKTFSDISNEADIIGNKRLCLSLMLHIPSQLDSLYGEIDYTSAFLTEAILHAPFLLASLRGKLDEHARVRHTAYIEEMVTFARQFRPDDRFSQFKKLTAKYPVEWAEEFPPLTLSPFDREYLLQVYDLAKSVAKGEGFDIASVYKQLSQTIMRRGNLFIGAEKREQRDNQFREYLELTPTYKTRKTFADIAGYERQREYFERLLAYTESNDLILKDVPLIIIAGLPGVGKSLMTEVFLNNLPKNARGVKVKVRSSTISEIEILAQIANEHPDLHIFAVMEDLDRIVRERYDAMRILLEIDSITDTMPSNLHILAPTNKPDQIGTAVLRPGRSTAVIFPMPKEEDEVRSAILQLHAEKNGVIFSDELLSQTTALTKDFTPAEIEGIVTTLKFFGVIHPKFEDVQKTIGELNERKKLKEGKN